MLRKSCSRLRSAFSLSCPPWLSVFLLCSAGLMSTELKCARGMQLTSTGPQTIQKAEGESVILGCTYTPSPLDTGDLDIEWSVVSPDSTQKDQMLMSYSSGTRYVHGNPALAKELSFAAPDPSMGDASISISVLSPAHSATYQCKVKKSPGVDMRKVSLVVLAKPSVPKCWVEGGELVGEALSLHCKSAKGSTPLKYTWRRESAGPIPAAATQNSVTGELKISNHSQSFAGFYLCEVNNAVGAEHCRINLKANKPPNRAAMIVGTIVGSLLLILILLVFIGLLYWKLSNRLRFEKEFSNDIREDAPPPESRPVSRHTSRSASQHPQVTYCPVGSAEVSSLSDGHTHTPSSNSHGHTPLKYAPVEYDSKYGYAV
ncbi:V-set and immunoglobulin domain-containing protein 8a [Epinephelus moara]|uniref:V-set and immunoglobulin domain-containing protein 8a n=1 Tax=Epinephelus moara TaxID=300413 RepID=UPI00214F1D6C|nr:V-set and immunoglobulin domain-containing protein 8a [Epinephelus moara]XP_049909130.1 V-set and immunoglobulin domain-containing protein 8a [Epinephelus moara]